MNPITRDPFFVIISAVLSTLNNYEYRYGASRSDTADGHGEDCLKTVC